MFNQETIEVLKKAGWYPGRKIDSNLYVKALEEVGFTMFNKAIQFIEEFGDLEFIIEETKNNSEIIVTKHNTNIMNILSIFKEAENSELIRRKYFDLSKYTSEETIPVGVLADGEMYFFITETGKIVTETVIEGMTIEEGLKSIICNTGAVSWEKEINISNEKNNDFMNIMSKLKNGEVVESIRKK